jgi:hypothetical protein
MRKLMWAIPVAATLTAGWLLPAAPAGATAGREMPTMVRESADDPNEWTGGTVHDNSTKCVSGIRTIVISQHSHRCIRK